LTSYPGNSKSSTKKSIIGKELNEDKSERGHLQITEKSSSSDKKRKVSPEKTSKSRETSRESSSLSSSKPRKETDIMDLNSGGGNSKPINYEAKSSKVELQSNADVYESSNGIATGIKVKRSQLTYIPHQALQATSSLSASAISPSSSSVMFTSKKTPNSSSNSSHVKQSARATPLSTSTSASGSAGETSMKSSRSSGDRGEKETNTFAAASSDRASTNTSVSQIKSKRGSRVSSDSLMRNLGSPRQSEERGSSLFLPSPSPSLAYSCTFS